MTLPAAAISTMIGAGAGPKFWITTAASTALGSAGSRRAAKDRIATLRPRRPTGA